MTICVLNNSDLVEFLVLHVGLALQCSNLLMEYQLLNATRSKSVNKWQALPV